MQKVYERINWENEPSTNTAVNEQNLNKMDYALDKLDDRVLSLSGYEERAKECEENAKNSKEKAFEYANESESFAHGATGTRDGENIDNAKYYYEQARMISESVAGALLPMGTVSFANLPSAADAIEGWMYNISDQFTTTAEFKEGSGNVIPAGSNVYKTVDGYWDVLAGSPVTGVKGNNESTYRRGNVNITADDIGLGNVPDLIANVQAQIHSLLDQLEEIQGSANMTNPAITIGTNAPDDSMGKDGDVYLQIIE